MVDFWIETIIYTQKYWWLRSPDTDWYGDVYLVYLSGSVSSGGNDGIGSVYASYGRIIAIHGRRQLHQRLVSLPFRCCRLRLLPQQPCQRFLRYLVKICPKFYPKILVVKIADHEQRRCVERDLVRCRRRHQLQCRFFLRIYSYSYKGIFSC